MKEYLQLAGNVRWFRVFVALVMLMSVLIPTYFWISDAKAYALTPETEKVIGKANKNLSAKFSFDKENNKWQFNKNGVAALASNIAKQQGGKDAEGVAGALSQLAAEQIGGAGKNDQSLYSVDLPTKAKEGITYYDNVTRLSFKMVPTFSSRDGKLVDGRIVYPFGGGGQVVYTAKSNGLKEDIVLSKYIGDTLRYGYELKLPDTLEARVLDGGSIGVYSANPALFGNINFSNDEDKARVMEGRKNGSKDNLVFGIPAPFIKDQTGKVGHTRYELDGKNLTVVAEGLKGLSYPLTVDPSVTVTSSSDFESGNNEGMIGFDTAGQVSRAGVTGGMVNSVATDTTCNTAGSWCSVQTGASGYNGSGAGGGGARHNATLAYNGFLYSIGGNYDNNSTSINTVSYAPLNASNGSVGTWTVGSSLIISSGTGLSNFGSAVYNGYIYVVGGQLQGGTSTGQVQYALICTGLNTTGGCTGSSPAGSVGTWTAVSGSNFGTVSGDSDRSLFGATVYNGYIYTVGGLTGGTFQNDTLYAPILANGSLGAWQQTTNLPVAGSTVATVYNGHMYVATGCNQGNRILSPGGCTATTSLRIGRINPDGSIANWSTGPTYSVFGVANSPGMIAYNGYLYVGGGAVNPVSTVTYAPIYANGSVGSAQATSSFTTIRAEFQLAATNGYLYEVGGQTNNGTQVTTDTQYAKINSAGSIGAFPASLGDFDASGRWGHTSIAAAGYLYVFGGQYPGGGFQNSGRYARICDGIIASDGCSAGSANVGSLGTWGSTPNFVDGRFASTVETYGNSIYLIGGEYSNPSAGTNCTDNFIGGSTSAWGCPDVQRGVINPSTGALTWSGTYTYSSTAIDPTMAGGRSGVGSAVVNNYLYVMGGKTHDDGTSTAEVDMAPINSDGTLGTFSRTTNMGTARRLFDAVSWNGHIYAIAGQTTRSTEYATINSSNGTISSWQTTGNNVSGGSGTGLNGAQAVVHNGYLYMAGGLGTAGGFLSTVQIARVNSDGTLGNWGDSPNAFATPRYGLGLATYNGYLYVVGGCSTALCPTSGLHRDVQHTRITNGGSGMNEAWANKGSFTTARSQAATATYNGYVYLTGGCTASTGIAGCTASTNDTRYAQVASDGSLTWSALDSNFPTNRYGHTSVAYNGYLYVIGGCSSTGGTNGFCTTFLDDVQRIKLNADGNTTGNSWTASSALSLVRYGASATVYKGYLYVAGGCGASASGGCSVLRSTIDYAQINSDGSLGSWATTGGNFTQNRFLLSSVAYAGKLYIAGGCASLPNDTCTSLRNDVQYAIINSDGTVSSTWNNANSFATPRFGASLTAQNGMLYLTGGCSANSAGVCTTFQGDTLTASISNGGSLGSWWKQISGFTDARYLHSGVLANGNLYLLGGTKTGPALLSDSMGTTLQLQSRLAQYSKVIPVSPTTDIASVYYNGSLADGSSIQYRVAPSSGVFGGINSATQGTGSEPTPLCGVGSIYYVQIMITFDDSTNAVFADDRRSNVTDITIYYRLNATPPPNLRLNGGKWFYGEAQQALDICRV